MKQTNKLLNTFLIIGLVLILVTMFKYFHFIKLPDAIKNNYSTFVSYPGVGGVLSIISILGGMYLVFDVWKISSEEKLIKAGKKSDVVRIKKLHSEAVLSEKDVENKFKILLNEANKEQKINESNIENQKKLDLIKNLSELKDKGVLTQEEFEEKKTIVLSK